MTRSELYVAEEAFLTGTAAEIIPVASVDDRPTAAAGCGPITAHLRDAFHDVVRGRNPAYRHWLEYVGDSGINSSTPLSPAHAAAPPAPDTMALLEDGVAQRGAPRRRGRWGAPGGGRWPPPATSGSEPTRRPWPPQDGCWSTG